MKASVYIATSLDGFIARANGDIDWLPGGGSVDDGEDYGYEAFMATIDVLVMGRHTYEKALTFTAWPYGSTSVVVLSSTQVHIPQHLAASVESVSCAPGELVRRLVAHAIWRLNNAGESYHS